MTYAHWTTRDEQYLTEHYGVSLATQIATHLDRSVPAIKQRAELLGLTSSLCHQRRIPRGTVVTLNMHGLSHRKIASLVKCSEATISKLLSEDIS